MICDSNTRAKIFIDFDVFVSLEFIQIFNLFAMIILFKCC